MLNQVSTSISSMRTDETTYYGNVDLSCISVTKRGNYYFIYVKSDGQAIFAKKTPKNHFGETWAAFNNSFMNGKPIYTAYSLKNLKGKIATYEA